MEKNRPRLRWQVVKVTECNNEGKLSFEYNLEDTDSVGGTQVFNGQDSVLWNNVRDAFQSELTAMYQTIRSGRYFNYAHVKQMFEEHQSVWPERLWNEDAYTKYLVPFLTAGDDNLDMLQGDKSSQRDWWLFNAFRYRDSKYVTSDALSNSIYFRGYTDETHPINQANITLTPYSHLWAAISFASATSGDSYMPTARLERNQSHTFMNPMDNMSDTEIYIRSADRLSDVGDLSAMNMGSANFSAATKLQRLIIGSSSPGYVNTHLESLTVGANELLTLLNVCNCTALATNVDLSGCASIETVLATGSAVTGVQLPVGGHLERLELPNTVTNLTIQNQSNLETFVMEGYNSLQTLRIENTPNIPVDEIIDGADNLYRVRLIGVSWEADDSTALMETIDKLSGCIGMDVNGNNTERAVVVGTVYVDSMITEEVLAINDIFPQLTVIVGNTAQYIVRYVDYDGTLLYRYVVSEGANAIDPVATGAITAPTRPDDDDGSYLYDGWVLLPTNIHANQLVTVRYTGSFRVRYMNPDGTELWSASVADGGTVSYGGRSPTMTATAQYSYTFQTWDGADDARNGQIYQVTGPTTVMAVYTNTLRRYTVYWRNSDNTLLETDTNVAYGSSATYDGATPVHPTDPDGFEFSGFDPDGQSIVGNTTCVAQYTDTRTPLLKYLGSSLDVWDNDTVASIAPYAFYRQNGLTTVRTSATSIGAHAFERCENLKTVDLTASGQVTIGTQAFYYTFGIEAIIIRSNSVAQLSSLSIFPDEPFGTGIAAVYVPDSLVDSYKVASNWYLVADRIMPISKYPTTDFSTISDNWNQIIRAVNNGEYASKYHIGDRKKLNIEGYDGDIYMEIVAMDTDVLSNNSGTAKITWIAREPYISGIFSPQGWADSPIREYLNGDFVDALPANIADAIREVKKTYFNPVTVETLTCDDKIWVPSLRELGLSYTRDGIAYVESGGVTYSGAFTNSASRSRHNYYHTRTYACTTSGSTYYMYMPYVSNNGTTGSSTASTSSSGYPNSGNSKCMFGFCM